MRVSCEANLRYPATIFGFAIIMLTDRESPLRGSQFVIGCERSERSREEANGGLRWKVHGSIAPLASQPFKDICATKFRTNLNRGNRFGAWQMSDLPYFPAPYVQIQSRS